MPITKSAKKALRQSQRRNQKNLLKKGAYKKAVKEYKKAVSSRKLDEAKNILSKVYKTLDKAAKANVIHKNKAGRIKSRLSQLIAKSSKASS